ncbi:hypothetical protein KAU33_00550 [Candidatus Dependentiae bacterium]|nr:hypothetical protein [Candidatus Dependentiae bacterium]
MIKYDYEIIRDESDETRVYTPKLIPKVLDNLIFIEGPNSSGKSTLLNIIALGFHGLFKTELNPILKKKLRNFLTDPDQQFSFRIEIDNPYDGYSIISEKTRKDKDDIIVYKINKGKKEIFTPDRLHRNFNIIYDIPDNPMDRVKQLTNDIKDKQTELGNRVGTFRNFLIEVNDEIKKGRDPERIKSFKDTIKELGNKINSLEEKSIATKNLYLLIVQYTLFKYFSEYDTQYQNINNELNSIDKGKIKSRRDDKKYTKELLEVKNQIKEKIGFLQFLLNSVSLNLKILLPKDQKHLLDLWNSINVNDEIENPNVYNNIENEGDLFIKELDNILNSEKDEKKNKEIRLLHDIINLLNNYRASDIIIPGIDKNISDFIEILQKKIDANKEIIDRQERLEKTIGNLLKMIELKRLIITQMIPKREKYKLLHRKAATTSLTIEEQSNRHNELRQQLQKVQRKREDYRRKLISYNIDKSNMLLELSHLVNILQLKPYINYHESLLNEKIDEMKLEFTHLQKDLTQKKESKKLLEEDLKKLEVKKPHEYVKNRKEIENLIIK